MDTSSSDQLGNTKLTLAQENNIEESHENSLTQNSPSAISEVSSSSSPDNSVQSSSETDSNVVSQTLQLEQPDLNGNKKLTLAQETILRSQLLTRPNKILRQITLKFPVQIALIIVF